MLLRDFDSSTATQAVFTAAETVNQLSEQLRNAEMEVIGHEARFMAEGGAPDQEAIDAMTKVKMISSELADAERHLTTLSIVAETGIRMLALQKR
jgi:hypothetical protein